MKALMKKTVLLAGLTLGAVAFAQSSKVVEMNLVNAEGVIQSIGTVSLEDSQYGLVITPNLNGLMPGIHGFHFHEKPNCGPDGADGKKGPALAAGGHLDPQKTGKHDYPWGDGHLGDIPALYVNADGNATYPVLAPRLKLKDVENRSLMIHEGGENHSDHPAPLGGGGTRAACGLVK